MIYSFCSFFNELELMKVRLEIMKPLDCTNVFIESIYTHAGDKKELCFNTNDLSDKCRDSIVYGVYEKEPTGDTWQAEKGQRDFALELVGDWIIEDDDICIITDLDEVVDPDCIKYFKPYMGCASLRMDKFSYYINVLEGYQTWNVGRICTGKYLRGKTLSEIRNTPAPFDIPMCGWHWSFCMGADRILEKLFSYAHVESLTPFTTDPENLKRKLKDNQSMWTEDVLDVWQLIPIDNRFPPYIRDNEQYLTDLGLIKPYK